MERTFNHPYEIVYRKCKEALRRLEMSIDEADKGAGRIQASTGGSLLSWGEDIDIEVKRVSASKTKVSVESTANAQLFSWGKNEANEKNFINALSELLK